MIQDRQIKKLRRLLAAGKTLAESALRTGMTEKTARKYRNMEKLPSEAKQARTYRTRQDPLEPVWASVEKQLVDNPGLQATTILSWLMREQPGQFDQTHLRTVQRRLRQWRALSGPGKEVFFKQVHHPGDLAASDFTDMNSLGVQVGGQRLDHMLYHFVLTYSNWEAITLCYSESFESLSDGLQNAMWKLGAVPRRHRTDRLSAAVNNQCDRREFTVRYQQLMNHYGVAIEKTQPNSPHENGDAESLHGHLKKAVDQALMLRGSRNFESLDEYKQFLQQVVDERNASRGKRVSEEVAVLRELPSRRLDDHRTERVRVNSGSLVQVLRNTYSVHSRLIGEHVDAHVHSDHIEIWYAQKCVERFPRLRGYSKHSINYRHVIDWLVRKPGAVANYQYQDSLYPTIHFRMAYDYLRSRHADSIATKEYLAILEFSARENQDRVDAALRTLLDRDDPWSHEQVIALARADGLLIAAPTDVEVAATDLNDFDALLSSAESLKEENMPLHLVSAAATYSQFDNCAVDYDVVLAQR